MTSPYRSADWRCTATLSLHTKIERSTQRDGFYVVKLDDGQPTRIMARPHLREALERGIDHGDLFEITVALYYRDNAREVWIDEEMSWITRIDAVYVRAPKSRGDWILNLWRTL